MDPASAQDIIERGRAAFLLVPRAPFRGKGTSGIGPSFGSPTEIVKNVSVIHADVQCAFVLDGSDKVRLAFTVK